MSALLVRATERFVVGTSDVRALFGSEARDWQPVAQPEPDKRAEAWAWIMRQWELWPRPDLIQAIMLPAFLRPSVRRQAHAHIET